MAMTRKTITIPNAMEDWIKTQVSSGRYCNDSEYLRDLIRKDQDKNLAKEQLLSLLDEGLKSGVSKNNIPDIMKNVESRLQKNGKIPAH